MNENNPYESPAVASSDESIDPKLLIAVAQQLAAARENPPTILSVLTTWPGTPLLVLVGTIGTAILIVMASIGDTGITNHWPLGFACFVIGACLRDFGTARRANRVWPPQTRFIDWRKVEEFAQRG